MATLIPKESKYLTVNELAQRFNVSKWTIYAWNRDGILPAPLNVNGRVRFSVDDVLAWEQSRKVRAS